MRPRTKLINMAGIIDLFCASLDQGGKSCSTIKNRRNDLDGLVRWSKSRNQRAFSLSDFLVHDLEAYQEWLVDSFKATTAKRRLATLNVFLAWAADQNLLERRELRRVQTVKLKPQVRPRPRWLDLSEQARLLQAVEEGGRAKDIAAINVMLSTGLRMSEVCDLRWGDVSIDGENGTLNVLHRGQDKPRHVPLNRFVREALISLGYQTLAGTTNPIFQGRSGAITRRALEMLVARYFQIAGIKDATPRALRHSFIMNLVNEGIKPQIIAMLAGNGNMNAFSVYYTPTLQEYSRAIDYVWRQLERPDEMVIDPNLTIRMREPVIEYPGQKPK